MTFEKLFAICDKLFIWHISGIRVKSLVSGRRRWRVMLKSVELGEKSVCMLRYIMRIGWASNTLICNETKINETSTLSGDKSRMLSMNCNYSNVNIAQKQKSLFQV